MNKKTLALLLALLMTAFTALSSCVLAEEATSAEAAIDPETVIATAGDLSVTYDEVYSLVRTTINDYANYYEQYYGYQVDTANEDFQRSIAELVVENELYVKILTAKAEALGLSATEEELAAIHEQAQSEYDNIVSYYTSALSASAEEGTDIDAAVQELITESGYTLEFIESQLKMSALLETLYAYVTQDVTVTDEDVRAAFDTEIATLKETYDADKDAFLSAYLNGDELRYTPEGIRLVQSIYVVKEDEDEQDQEDEATGDEAEPADVALSGRAKIEAAKAELDAGADFTDVAANYTEDGSHLDELLSNGYPVFFGSGMYEQSFVDNAMALENVGDVSAIVETSYGYHLLRYAADLTSGAIDFDAVSEEMRENTLSEKKDDVYLAQETAWLEEQEIVMDNIDLLIEKTVVEPAAQAELIFASVNADTQLFDAPNGTALYDLKTGVTLSIEGKITVEEVEYAYVAVLGSTAMGYVPTQVLTVISQEDAEEGIYEEGIVALTVNAQEKKPIFTIVMNDGSVMYGELYPDIAPESVGNFVALANSDFYAEVIFHRVIAGFMIQGGDPNGTGSGGPGYAIKGEFSSNGVENGLSHTRGVLSMARSSAMDSAGSQFFICHADSTFLDGEYAGFGMLLGGFDTLDAIASVPTSSDRPVTDQIMKLVHVETYGVEYPFTKIED